MKSALLAFVAALPLLAACGGENQRLVGNDEYGDWRQGRARNRPQGASAGIVVFGVDKDREAREAAASGGGSGLSVNAYLWRATLDTLSFMPLTTADPWGGTVLTDWYTAPETPNERFKATVYILDTRLRADGLNVVVFKQVRDAAGNWVDSAVSSQTETDIENAILTRARQLRLATADR